MPKKGYIGIISDVPVYDIDDMEPEITGSNISDYFTVTNGTYYFKPETVNVRYFTTNNSGINSSTATTTLVAKYDMDVSFNYGYSSEANYDKFTLIFNGTTIENAVSGTSTAQKKYSGSLLQGQKIEFKYAKDSSSADGNDECYFSYMNLTIKNITPSGTERKSVAKKIEKIYIGTNALVPIYEIQSTQITVTDSNISNYFTVTNGTYYFKGSGSTFTTTNGGIHSSTASTTLVAKIDTPISFNYSYSSQSGYDKFTLVVNGTTIENAVSGATTSKSYSGTIKTGQKIEFTYKKDFLTSSNNDECTFSNMKITAETEVQIGEEVKQLCKRVKKAFLGIGGKARPMWNIMELSYFGTTADGLNVSRSSPAAMTLGNYAFFTSGRNATSGSTSSSSSSSIDIYDDNLTYSKSARTVTDRKAMAFTKTANHAFIGGGIINGTSGNTTSDVLVLDESLTEKTVTSLRVSSRQLAATTIGNYAVFAGGYDGSPPSADEVTAYNNSLTRLTSADDLSVGRERMFAGSVGNYGLFIGGLTSKTNSSTLVVEFTYVQNIDAYNSSLTRSTPSFSFSTLFVSPGTTTFGNKLLIAGGVKVSNSSSTTTYLSTVYSVDTSLTFSTISSLNIAKANSAATILDKYVLFGGGNNGSAVQTVDVYDNSLTHSLTTPLPIARDNLSATTVGNYALFGQGTRVDVYTIN